jgi:histidine kinase
MRNLIEHMRHRMAVKLILVVGVTLLATLSTWAYFNIRYQEKRMMHNLLAGTDRLTTTIKLGAHYAMMLNSRDDINQIINNIARQKGIETIRIYNKQGQIKFTNRPSEVDTVTNIKAEACYICHRTDPPQTRLELAERTRMFRSDQGDRLLGIISPIDNEPGCSTDACHVHPEDKSILGALDVVVALEDADRAIAMTRNGMIGLTGFVFLITSAIILIFVLRFVNLPISKLIEGTRQIAKGVHPVQIDIAQDDELGQLGRAINRMSDEIAEKQTELNSQKDEYQTLFEQVPCQITVQDRQFRLLRYNRDFAESFDPEPGDTCYRAYKGRSEKCVNCPVEKTFRDGLPHTGEESGLNKDGSPAHWIFRTAPIRDRRGQIVAAMEMSLDITDRRQLEEQLEKSEKKYHEIFNNIPNPVYVLDSDTLDILDCNDSVQSVYGYTKDQVIGKSFLDLFADKEKDRYAGEVKTASVMTQVRHQRRDGAAIFVNIRISPAEYPGRKVLLVTTSDITKRLETEQQLIQSGKMATLGEMASGIAHELNQPLSVIKTVSSFFINKLDRQEPIAEEVLFNMLHKIDSNVDRAGRIINHMREFSRKSDMDFEPVQINEVLQRSFEIFSQQLKLRDIEVVWELDRRLPKISADPGRLEQVFINLLLNARDAIEQRGGPVEPADSDKTIRLQTEVVGNRVFCRVCDSGIGIPPTVADKIFEPFFTTKEVGKGTGLGLSISYGIVKDFGGTIEVVPNQPDGACFILTFPVADNSHDKNRSAGR